MSILYVFVLFVRTALHCYTHTVYIEYGMNQRMHKKREESVNSEINIVRVGIIKLIKEKNKEGKNGENMKKE